jgi:hypothetical protein
LQWWFTSTKNPEEHRSESERALYIHTYIHTYIKRLSSGPHMATSKKTHHNVKEIETPPGPSSNFQTFAIIHFQKETGCN